MLRKISTIVILVCMVGTLSGCFALLAGAGGTALWQAGKVVSEEMVSMDKAVSAVEYAFNKMDITQTDKVVKNEVTQIRGKDIADVKVAVDVFSEGPKNARIEVRYGLGEETAARDLLNTIKKKL